MIRFIVVNDDWDSGKGLDSQILTTSEAEF